MKRLAAGLGLVCLVLILLALEQRHAVAAWRTLRDDAAPTARRLFDWASSGAADGWSGLKAAVASPTAPLLADPGDAVLVGDFVAADRTTRDGVGGVTFVGALIRLDRGGSLKTQPLRIASGDERFAPDETFAERLDAAPNAQIELRRVASSSGSDKSAALCGGRGPGVVALLHRRDRVDLMLFAAREPARSDTAPSALCGVWRFRAR
jgi:hypothetical protein